MSIGMSFMSRKFSSSVILLFICVLLFACEDNSNTVNSDTKKAIESAQTIALPFTIDTDKSSAYLARNFLEVYLVSESDVLLIRLKLPDKNIPMLETEIINNDSEQRIVHFQGAEVSSLVLPSGSVAVREFQKGPGITRNDALAASIICKNPPRSGRFDYGQIVSISLRNLDFGGANQYHLDPISFKVTAFPP